MLKPVRFSIRDYLISEASRSDFQENVKRLSELGWVLPVTLGISSIRELGNPQQTDAEIDKWFVDYYQLNEFENFNVLLKSIEKAPSLVEWKRLIAECAESFKSGYKIVSIPALITIIEGCLSKKLGTFKSNNIRVIRPAKDKLDGLHSHELVKVLWLSLYCFVAKLYEKSDFSSDKPLFINRHWILHGRDSTQWADTDFFRLFNLLGALAIA